MQCLGVCVSQHCHELGFDSPVETAGTLALNTVSLIIASIIMGEGGRAPMTQIG